MSTAFNVNDVISIRHNFVLGESRAFNLLHYQINAKTGLLPNANTILATIAEDRFDQWSAIWSLIANVEVDMDGCSAQNISPSPRSRMVTYTPGAAVAGTIAGDALPLQDSLTLLKVSDFGERWGLGRVYVVGLGEASQASGILTAIPVQTALNVLAESLDDPVDIIGTGWTMTLLPVLYHAPTAATDDAPATVERITPIVDGRVSDWVIKSMKTRRPGKGI